MEMITAMTTSNKARMRDNIWGIKQKVLAAANDCPEAKLWITVQGTVITIRESGIGVTQWNCDCFDEVSIKRAIFSLQCWTESFKNSLPESD